MNTSRFYRWALSLWRLHPAIIWPLVYVLFFIRSFFFLDPDFGWHQASGYHILGHGIPQHDIYSYTMPQFPWIHHEWLADIGNYIVYHYLGGYGTIAAIYALLWTGVLWLVARTTNHRLLVVLAATLLLPFAGVRALTWSVVFSAILMVIMRQKQTARHWLVVPIMLFWANMHGSFVVGLAYLVWQWLMRRQWHTAWLVIAAGAVTICTPYGAGMYVEIIRTMTDTGLHTSISEWRSFDLSVPVCIFTGMWLAMAVVAKKPWYRGLIRFETVLFSMAISSMRQIPLFVLYALPFVLQQCRRVVAQVHTVHLPVQRLVIGGVLGLYVVSGIAVYNAFQPLHRDREVTYPIASVASLRAHPCRGNLFADYNAGGYLIWRLPGQRLYIDGRMPSWRQDDESILARYHRVLAEPTYRKQQFATYDIRCVILPRTMTLVKQLQKEGWHIATREATNADVLLVR